MEKLKLKVEKMFKIQKICSTVSCHNISENRLDKDIQGIAFSLNCTLSMFFHSKYNLRDGFIYPNGKTSRIVSILCMLFMNLSSISRIMNINVRDMNNDMTSLEEDFFTLLASFLIVTFILGFTTMFILDIVHRNNNVLLILNIQNIFKSIDLSQSIQNLIDWNWISTITIVIYNIFIHTLYYWTSHYPDIIDLIVDCIIGILFFALEINLVVATRIIIILRKCLDQWIEDFLMMNGERDTYASYLKFLQIYRNIIKAYNLYKRIFQVLVSS